MESPPEIVNFGKSLIVPSVQELAKQSIIKIPPRYVHHQDTTPVAGAGIDSSLSESVPVVDLHNLIHGASSIDSDLERETLHSACRNWGFFQVVNHGVSTSLLEDLKREITELFNLPLEEKKKLWQTPENHEGFGQLFVVSEEQKLDWSDMFYMTTLPINLRQRHLFDNLPALLRETLDAYSEEVKKLAMAILGQMAKALSMDDNEIGGLFASGVQSMRLNYYPPCPEPDMAIGFTHPDANALTILYQLNETEGLQIRRDGRWLNVKPLPNTFIANIGDIMEIVSNGEYRSIEHRAIVNSAKERLSIATFYSPPLGSELGPARSLVGPNSRAAFRQVPIEEYFKEFFARKLNGKSYLDFMKIEVVEADPA